MRSLNFTFVFFVGYMWSIASMLSSPVTEYSSRSQGENDMTTSTTTPGATDIPVNGISPISGQNTESDTTMSPISGKYTQSDTTNVIAVGTIGLAVFIGSVVTVLVWLIRRYKKKKKDVRRDKMQLKVRGSNQVALNKREGNIKGALAFNNGYVIPRNTVYCCQCISIGRCETLPSTSPTKGLPQHMDNGNTHG